MSNKKGGPTVEVFEDDLSEELERLVEASLWNLNQGLYGYFSNTLAPEKCSYSIEAARIGLAKYLSTQRTLFTSKSTAVLFNNSLKLLRANIDGELTSVESLYYRNKKELELVNEAFRNPVKKEDKGEVKLPHENYHLLSISYLIDAVWDFGYKYMTFFSRAETDPVSTLFAQSMRVFNKHIKDKYSGYSEYTWNRRLKEFDYREEFYAWLHGSPPGVKDRFKDIEVEGQDYLSTNFKTPTEAYRSLPELDRIDFKRSVNEKVGKEMAAFASTSKGGRIVIGITEIGNESGKRALVGIEDVDGSQSKIQNYSESVRDIYGHSVDFEIVIRGDESKYFEVFVEGKGIPHAFKRTFYERQAESSQKLEPQQVRKRILELEE